jgi:hypothetical protein
MSTSNATVIADLLARRRARVTVLPALVLAALTGHVMKDERGLVLAAALLVLPWFLPVVLRIPLRRQVADGAPVWPLVDAARRLGPWSASAAYVLATLALPVAAVVVGAFHMTSELAEDLAIVFGLPAAFGCWIMPALLVRAFHRGFGGGAADVRWSTPMWILVAVGAMVGLYFSIFFSFLPLAGGGVVWLVDAGIAAVVRRRLAAEDALLGRGA